MTHEEINRLARLITDAPYMHGNDGEEQRIAELIRLAHLGLQHDRAEQWDRENGIPALERVRQDLNWMLNNRQFLNPDTFDYIDQALESCDNTAPLEN